MSDDYIDGYIKSKERKSISERNIAEEERDSVQLY